MKSVLLAASIALLISLLGTPMAIRLFRRLGYGQEIREDGPTSHISKRGTPTMGGGVIIVAILVGYFMAHLVTRHGPTVSGLLVLGVMVGLGAIGFADDFIKIRKQRSLGLSPRMKFIAQLVVAIGFGILALKFRNEAGLTPASPSLSLARDTAISLGSVGFVVWAYLLISGASNGVNLTDGLDGLASGTAAMAFAAYVIIAFWQFGNACTRASVHGCYTVRDPLDAALIAAAAMGACFGFLWWNATPAKIFMGDTGSLAIGGTFAALAMVTRTEMLLAILGGLFVLETLSVIIQVAFFKATKKRVFKMAPIHHHFELGGWPETTVIIRFWIIAGLTVALGLGVFYAEFLAQSA